MSDTTSATPSPDALLPGLRRALEIVEGEALAHVAYDNILAEIRRLESLRRDPAPIDQVIGGHHAG